MRYTIIHDTPDLQGREILEYLREKTEKAAHPTRDIRFFDLGQVNMEPCLGCFNCWLKTPGLCVFKDDASKLMKEEILSDRILYLCPVTWGSYSPAVKILQDRSLGRVLPFFVTHKGETHHPLRYGKGAEPFLAGYGDDLSGEEEEVFRRTGENLNDNIYRGKMNTLILRSSEDYAGLDRFFEGDVQ
ncbi:NAD(P)H-dependent oxidoreductase [Oceanispirochaeta sp.]|uniref:NAD(P)H-dependent oxidoreductase n=1 Tax=Oceanispirochaeta sp. TaxID=2035350 RepID=UPI002618991D|nr:NAD(P)H-dependent oxidoreductase [Oceanispirochaeta sp.]MDA3955416.1 NAD(P)H-dependent oxidoreductase [Oceanispirochaeta sp.]